jgi:hypothetical protein
MTSGGFADRGKAPFQLGGCPAHKADIKRILSQADACSSHGPILEGLGPVPIVNN